MQDEEWFRLKTTQEMMVDILFVFCKINVDVSYRQGMHELLAPILWTVQNDAVRVESVAGTEDESRHLDLIDATFVEHDAYALFSKVMETAKSSYEQGYQPHQDISISNPRSAASTAEPPIVERSRYVHEELLSKVDPDLATHLTAIEILPQIFLIRWVRLLFGREFQFDKLLDLWDALLAEGLSSDLVNLVCLAMLLRIRWKLLDADYSTALGLLLHYPHGLDEVNPASFVKDAIFLRTHLTSQGGSHVIAQHTYRSPSLQKQNQPQSSRFQPMPTTPIRRVSGPQQGPSAARISVGIDKLVQGAAKGVLSRSEKWGWNRVVQDAVGEVRKNVQGLQSGDLSWNRAGPRWPLDEDRFLTAEPKENLDTVKSILHRNESLAQILATVTSELSDALNDQTLKGLPDATTLAISKLNLVRICLEDSTIPIQFESIAAESDNKRSKDTEDGLKDDANPPAPMPDAPIVDNTTPSNPPTLNPPPSTSNASTVGNTGTLNPAASISRAEDKPTIELRRGNSPLLDQPRSSIAKSSFAWMLGEDDAPPSGFKSSPFSLSPTPKEGDSKGSQGPSLLFGDSDKLSHKDRIRKKGQKGVEDLLMGDL
jgi:TBC1 domain family protein 5